MRLLDGLFDQPAGSWEMSETSEKCDVTPDALNEGSLKHWKSGHGCHRSSTLLWRRSNDSLLNQTTGFAYPRSRFQKGDLPAGKTTVMDELITHRATRPASPEHRLVPIEVFLANSAETRLNWKRHRLPLAAAFSNAHTGRKYSGTTGGKTSEGNPTSRNQTIQVST